MEELQKLINSLKFEKEKALSMYEYATPDQMGMIAPYEGKVKAFSFAIDEAEKLLKSGRKQQPL